MKRIEMVGRKFGRLKVLRVAPKVGGRGELRWVVTCTCGSGKTKVLRGYDLRAGNTQGCGCLNPVRLRPYESLYRKLVRDAKTARKRVVPITLTYRQFLTFVNRPCYYCWAKIDWSPFKNGNGYHLDRKDSRRGYSIDNCVACCTRCNRGKSDLFSFIEWRRMTSCFRH